MDERFENIMLESMQLFQKYGIRSVSMDDIAKEQGISKKTLYQYVVNKGDLIDKILQFKIDSSCDYFSDIADSEQNAIDVLLEISKQVSKSYQEATPNMHYDMQKYYPEILKKHEERHKKIVYEGVKQNIAIGLEQGLYRDDLDDNLIAELYVKKLQEMNDEEFLKNIRYSFKKIFEVMFDAHIRAIVNDKGLEYYLERKKALKFKV